MHNSFRNLSYPAALQGRRSRSKPSTMWKEHNTVMMVGPCGGNKEGTCHDLLAATRCIRSSTGWSLTTTTQKNNEHYHFDINEVIRLGKKTQDGKPRPMKVIMKNPERKVRLFKKLWKLRDATESYRGLSIQNDLTKKEREEEKKLLDEARVNEALDGGKPDSESEAHHGHGE